MSRTIIVELAFLFAGIAMSGGCSRGPEALVPPEVDAAGASSAAMQQYDTNGDGSISGDELKSSPALKTAIKRVDANGDGAIADSEIADRIKAWQKSGVALFPARCAVNFNGAPFEGAEVRFEPEGFLGDEVQAAVGITNGFGETVPAIPKDKRPQASMTDGMQFGFYTVRISKIVNGKETVPARYNTESQLGEEISMETPGIQTGYVRFELKSQ